MNRSVPAVRPMSRAKIEGRATQIVQAFSQATLDGASPFPLLEFCERGHLRKVTGVDFAVDDLPPGVEGRVAGKYLFLDARVYDRLIEGDPRARFTCAHEIGHASLHADQIEIINSLRGQVTMYRRGSIPPYRDPEWQANVFAAALLMPTNAIHVLMGNRKAADDAMLAGIVSRLGVSREAASYRLKGIRAEKTERLTARFSSNHVC